MSRKELSKAWYAARRLREEGKALTAVGGVPLEEIIEKRMFEAADKRIDLAIKQKRGRTVFEAKKGGRK